MATSDAERLAEIQAEIGQIHRSMHEEANKPTWLAQLLPTVTVYLADDEDEKAFIINRSDFDENRHVLVDGDIESDDQPDVDYTEAVEAILDLNADEAVPAILEVTDPGLLAALEEDEQSNAKPRKTVVAAIDQAQGALE